MKSSIYSILILAFVVLNFGCATTGMNSGTGAAWINPGTTEGVMVTAHKQGTKTGEACTSNILGIFASGDASVDAAAKAGSISSVSSVDRRYTNYLFIYGKMCTIVTGN